MAVKTVAMLTAGGLAPCLSSAVGGLIERYTAVAPNIRIIAYRNGYAGLLTGDWVEVTPAVRANAHKLHAFGGTPIGNSRVKLTNVEDCVRRGLVQPGQDPLEVAAEQGALYARNIIAEHSSNPRMLIVHEVMGRNCGWLTAATAHAHHRWVKNADFAEWLENSAVRWDVHGVFVPERPFDIAEEAQRLRAIMDVEDGVNLFISEGAGGAEIVAAMEAQGEEVPRDPFGHVQLDKINPGQWFAKQFAAELGADKVLVQKSGYFSRSAAPNAADLALIRLCTDFAVDAALRGESGVVGEDQDRGGELRAIEFARIAGGKKFDVTVPWFTELLAELGQT